MHVLLCISIRSAPPNERGDKIILEKQLALSYPFILHFQYNEQKDESGEGARP